MKLKFQTITLMALLTFGLTTLPSFGGGEEGTNTEESHEDHDHDHSDHDGHDH
ncbi:hypothetical protein [Parvicella tangerina]|uniref:Uncharacterized protein n=1 Tax=Parvicella tangerina TaxID=2829795 RepID=A0A916JPQ8_9FLAO|nr:hypothetical protein [Parvicella tangerina]CAG5085994.1 hypothetical protein CRYO30217_02967 [Parvicella tangerina]